MAELLQREQQYTPLWLQAGRALNFHRWAGFSGAIAVAFAAYGEYGMRSVSFTTGSLVHLIHTLALLALPLARRPRLTGTLFLIGIFFFSFGCYCRALFAIDAFAVVNLIGSFLLLVAWISFIF